MDKTDRGFSRMNADKTQTIYIRFDPQQSALVRGNFCFYADHER